MIEIVEMSDTEIEKAKRVIMHHYKAFNIKYVLFSTKKFSCYNSDDKRVLSICAQTIQNMLYYRKFKDI